MKKKSLIGILAVLAMVMTASGALLDYYGQITGTADVEQSVLVDNGNYEQSNTYDANLVAGSTNVSVHTLENQANVTATINFSTTQNGDGDNVFGINTSYVEYFDDAGADIPVYSTEIRESVVDVVVPEDYNTIQGALESITTEDPVILVKSSYDSSDESVGEFTHPDGEGPEECLIRANPTLSEQDWSGELTIVSKAGPSETVINAQDANYGVVIGGGDTVATVKGFDIQNYQNVGVLAGSWHNVEDNSYVNPERVNVIHNYFGRGDSDKFTYGVELAYTTTGTVKYNDLDMQGLTGEKEVGSMLIAETSDVVVSNNIITNGQDSDELGIAVATFGGMFSGVETPLKNLTIKHNTITGGEQGIGIESVGEMSGVTIKDNEITGSDTAVDIVEYSDNGGSITDTKVNYNTIVSDITDIDYQVDGTLDATNNWWGTDGISVSENVDASWMDKGPQITLEPGETDTFGIVNDFNVALVPGTYTVTTEVVPVT